MRFILAEPGTVTGVTLPEALDPAVSLTTTAEPGTEVPPPWPATGRGTWTCAPRSWLFPDLSQEEASRLVDEAQLSLKADCAAQGVMIGEFHDGPPPKPGLWNPHSRPPRSPVPMPAIRSLVSTDFPFLRDDPAFVAAGFGLTPAPQPVGHATRR
ncbi:hypothetical protein LZG04_26355 [Saccharothrix sp. S26]|uniref:DUF6875 domain-containing protein n=1 Tax=Saccharothrix sp. S26 TaxID=2907215 RepID=UPI001F483EF7|nr:hypothetical protein [Saccharothrix sp. S26]MCE6998294.1 hypothetical protein [Saccharothrix sp. S26]